MRKAHLLPFFVLSTAVFACSSSSGGGAPDATPVKDSGTPDHAAHDTGTKDTGTKDVGTNADAGSDDAGEGFDAGPPPTPVGTQIESNASGQNLQIVGVTDDGFVIYISGSVVKSIPEAGGTAKTLVDTGEAGANGIFASVLHNDVFVWWNLSDTGSSTLSVWNSTLSSPAIVSTSSYPFAAAVSDDSATVAFATETSADGSAVNLVGATIASPTTLHPLLEGVDPGSAILVFSGSGSSLYAIAAGGTPATTDGGEDGPQIVKSFLASGATWTGATLASDATTFSIDDTGAHAAITLPNGDLEIVALSGAGTPVIVGAAADAGADAASTLSLGTSLYLSSKDSFVLFDTASNALVSAKVTPSPLTTLLTTGANDIDALSPDESLTFIDTGFDSNTGLVTGLTLASTATPSTSTAFVTGTNEAGLFGDAFTADGKYALYLSNVTQDDNNFNVGTLTAAAVGALSTPISVAMASGTSSGGSLGLGQLAGTNNLSNTLLTLTQIEATQGASSFTATHFALTGSQIVFVDNFNSDGGFAGQADIKFVDLSTTTAAVTVMKSADPLFAISPDKKHIIYTVAVP